MKNKRLVDHICSIATLRYEVFLMSDNFFFLQETEAVLEYSRTFMVWRFCEKSYQLKVVSYFYKKASP